ncbi:hypothetical protein HDV06_005680 [Boothiomyces sp. JEL0866]|nr:hypothetical protein HDV06_005680 [Boothiomyces sp. JEL0866]
MAFTGGQLQILNVIVKISASLGFMGFALLMYQFNKYQHEFKSAMGKIVIVLAIGDLLDSCVKAIGPIGYYWGSETFLCQCQGTIILFANNSSIFNSLTIGLWAVYLTYFNGDVKYILRHDYKFIVLNLCIATTFSLLAALLPPSAFLVVWIPITINRMVIATTGNSYFVLAVIQAIFSPSRGFYYALAFILSKRAQSLASLNNSTAQLAKSSAINSPPLARKVDLDRYRNTEIEQYEDIFEIDQYLNV